MTGFFQRLTISAVLAFVGMNLFANAPVFVGGATSGPAALAAALLQSFTIAYVAVCAVAAIARLARRLWQPALPADRQPPDRETSSTAS